MIMYNNEKKKTKKLCLLMVDLNILIGFLEDTVNYTKVNRRHIGYLTCLCLNFLTCNLRIIIVTTSYDYCGD